MMTNSKDLNVPLKAHLETGAIRDFHAETGLR